MMENDGKWWKMGHRSCVSLFVDLTVAKPSGKRLQKTVENGHRNNGFSHWTWWFSIVLCKRLPEGILCSIICSPELFLNIISHHCLQRSWNKIRKKRNYYFCEVRSLSETALAMKTNTHRIHVCYIWWHLPSIYPSHVSINIPAPWIRHGIAINKYGFHKLWLITYGYYTL